MAESKTAKAKVLTAEDNSSTLRLLTVSLEDAGYEVLSAKDGWQALEIFRHQDPDVIVTDLRMPALDGQDFLNAIMVESPQTPVIVISGAGTIEDVVFALQNGAWDYIPKPVDDYKVIVQSVEKALRHREMITQSCRYQEILEEKMKEMVTDLEKQRSELEEEIKKRRIVEHRIEQAKLEWERTVDAMPDMIALLDRNHNIIRANKSMAHRLGMEPWDIVGRKCYSLLHDQHKPLDLCPHERLMKEGRPSPDIELYEEKLKSYLKISAIPYLDPDGTVIGSVHIARDITRRKEMEKEKDQLQANLLHAQKMESVGQLAAGIAHEVNTPTQYIASNLDFLMDSFEDTRELISEYENLRKAAREQSFSEEIVGRLEETRDEIDWTFLVDEIPKALEQSREGTKRVSNIVRAMKEFSYPGGKEKNPEDINKIIENTLTVARNEWKYVAELSLDLDPDLPVASCLRDELGQVFLNIVVNAAQAIREEVGVDPEGEKGVIAVSSRVAGEVVEIRIADNGPGMSESVRERIFDPFFTTKTVGKGTGQGLSIAHDVIVEKHSGELYCDSEPGKGAAFTIRLPLNRN